jgi:hypothetical protein
MRKQATLDEPHTNAFVLCGRCHAFYASSDKIICTIEYSFTRHKMRLRAARPRERNDRTGNESPDSVREQTSKPRRSRTGTNARGRMTGALQELGHRGNSAEPRHPHTHQQCFVLRVLSVAE